LQYLRVGLGAADRSPRILAQRVGRCCVHALERDFGALVLDAPGLVIPAGQPAGLCRLDGHADAETDAQAFLQRATQSLALGAGERRSWIDADQDAVEPVDATEAD